MSLICLAWFTLQFAGVFSPGLLDDVDSVYIQVAREMQARHDFVTPTIDGVRFFDKPPLMYWMAAGSMRVLGVHDWAARLPLALGTLALLLSVYALGIRLFGSRCSGAAKDRGGFYAALVLATSIGPYLYTRFYIPDILLALWMTLAVHLTLRALEQVRAGESALLSCLGFSAVLALNVLTKGLIGWVFPMGFVVLFVALTRQFAAVRKLHLLASSGLFLLLALPWHVLAAFRNPAVGLPGGVGLPARAGWAWFYLYNEHVARFLSRRVPHDYGLTPAWMFWVYVLVWMMPYAVFLPAAVAGQVRALRDRSAVGREREAAVALLLWAGLVLGFFTVSNRQEYYSLPALPALALMVGGFLGRAEGGAGRSADWWTAWVLLPVTTVAAGLCAFFSATLPRPPAGVELWAVLASNPADYNLSLGHLFDLTAPAMEFFRGPLAAVAGGMLVIGPVSWLLRRAGRRHGAVLAMAAGMTVVLLAAHEALARFNPILGSKDLAMAINAARAPGDLILIDGELTSGSTLLFYTGQPVHLVNGRVNGPWFGSFWPDAPAIFETDETLRRLWAGPRRLFLMTPTPGRAADLARFGPVRTVAAAGGKTVLSNR